MNLTHFAGSRSAIVRLVGSSWLDVLAAAGVATTLGIAAAVDLRFDREMNLQIAYSLPVLIAALRFRPRIVLGVALLAIAFNFVGMLPLTEEAAGLPYSTVTFLAVCFIAVLVPEQRLRIAKLKEEARRRASEAEQHADQLTRLQAVLIDLAAARTVEQVAEVVAHHGASAVGADRASVVLVSAEGRDLVTVGAFGFEPATVRRWQRFPLDAPVLIADVIRNREAVWIESRSEFLTRYPNTSSEVEARVPDETWAAIPMIVRDKAIGAIGLTLRERQVVGANDRKLMSILAAQCAEALERVRLFAAEARLAAIASSSPHAIYAITLCGELITWNVGAEKLYGYSADDVAGKHIKLIIPEDRANEFDLLIEQVQRGELLTDFETVRVRRDGRPIHVSASIAPLRDSAGRVIGASIISRDITERKRQEYARQLLVEAGGALAISLDYEVALDRLVDAVVPTSGDWCAAYLVEDERFLRPVAVAAAQPASEVARRRSPTFFTRRPMPEIGNAVGDALRSGQSAEISNIGQNDGRLTFFELVIGELLWVLPPLLGIVVPMMARGRLIGALVFASAPGHLPGRIDLRTAEELARRAALAVDNGRLFQSERQARSEAEADRQRLTFLSEASRTLNSSLDYHATLSTLAKLTTPRVADWCQLFVYGDDGAIRQLASAHVDPSKLALLRLLDARYPVNPNFPDGTPLTRQSRQAQLIEEYTDELLTAVTQDPEHLRVLRALGPRSLIVIPLVARGRALGSMTFVISESDRRFSAADFSLAEQLAQRAANAIDRARLFQAEQGARKQAEAAVKIREEFIAVAAHELNTPLTNLRGYAQLEMLRIRRKGSADTRTVQRALTVIDQQSTRLANLVSRLLDATVLDLDQVDLDRASTDLGALVEDIVLQYQNLLMNHSIDLNVVPNVRASLDVGRFEAVVTNLLENAVRFNLDGGTIRVDVTCPGAGTVRLAVADDGPGIPLERRSHLFERFYQADRENNRSGLGLGLYVSHKIIALHGGELTAEFPLEGGTRFVVTLPTLPDQSRNGDEIEALKRASV